MAILALAGGVPMSRERLMGLLWSDRGEQQARSSLRQALTELRKALGSSDSPLLVADRDTLRGDPDAVEVDVVIFERLIEEGTTEALARAAELYRGDLLEGLDVRDAAFEAWHRTERERLRDRAGKALRRLLDQQAGTDAIATARRVLSLDPLDEATHRDLMRLLAGSGDRSAAIKQYDACRQLLQAELALLPDAETERLLEQVRRGEPDSADSSGPRTAAEPPLPDTPSIAVLPFASLSDDQEQAYFADGITEDIIAALSKIPRLLVIARNSTSIYRNVEVDVTRIGQEQGVSHVLEGSVRRSGERIRVTAQLIEAATGDHQWAEHYDRELDDIFEMQDEIAKKVATEMQVRLARGEEARVWARGTSNIEAWGKIARASQLTDNHVREYTAEAQRLAGDAVRLDPGYSSAWVMLGWTHWEDAMWGWGESRGASMETARSCAERALECDPDNPDALTLQGSIHMSNKQADKAIELCKKAVALSPSHANNIALAAMTMIFGGEPENGLPLVKRAMRLSPVYPQWYLLMVGVVHHLLGDQDEAIGIFRECAAKEPETTLHKLWLVSALVEAGRGSEAKRLAADVLEIDPDFQVAAWMDSFSADPALTDRLLTNLAAAGLPG